MFKEEEWLTLSKELLKLSLKQKISWEKWGRAFCADVGDVRYAVGSRDGDGRAPYYLSINRESFIEQLDEVGYVQIDSVETIPPSFGVVSDHDRISSNILQLISESERIANGTPQLFTELIENLQNLENPSPPF